MELWGKQEREGGDGSETRLLNPNGFARLCQTKHHRCNGLIQLEMLTIEILKLGDFNASNGVRKDCPLPGAQYYQPRRTPTATTQAPYQRPALATSSTGALVADLN